MLKQRIVIFLLLLICISSEEVNRFEIDEKQKEKKEEKPIKLKGAASFKSFSLDNQIVLEDSFEVNKDLEYAYANPSEESFDKYLRPPSMSETSSPSEAEVKEVTRVKTNMEKAIKAFEFTFISTTVRLLLKNRAFLIDQKYMKFINKSIKELGINLITTAVPFVIKNKYIQFSIIIGRFAYEQYGKAVPFILTGFILLILKIAISIMLKNIIKKLKLNIAFTAILHGVTSYYAYTYLDIFVKTYLKIK